eukprot:15438980-Alexandrium_andersonii.AAC.1
MAGGAGVAAPSGLAEVAVVSGGGREGLLPGDVPVEGRSVLVRSAEDFIDRLVETAGERGGAALDEMME